MYNFNHVTFAFTAGLGLSESQISGHMSCLACINEDIGRQTTCLCFLMSLCAVAFEQHDTMFIQEVQCLCCGWRTTCILMSQSYFIFVSSLIIYHYLRSLFPFL